MKSILTTLSLMILVMIAGCRVEEAATAPSESSEEQGHSHSHGDAPHGGTVFDWGGGAYHAEFTVNHDEQKATVYILGSNARDAEPIKADEINLAIVDPEIQIALKAEPLHGEEEGMSSRFSGTHENLGIVQEYEGKVFGTVDGKPYSGSFKELAHDH
ncbi:MAG: hypothetical protein AAGA30_08400 [Planctomycetota bacterium]